MQDTLTGPPITEQEIAEAIRSSTFAVFSTMLGIEVEAGETQTGGTAGSMQARVVALLGLAGEWIGSGSLSCDPPFARRMAAQLLMAEYDAVNEEVLDAVAEVANMIIGNIKTALEEKLGAMGLSTPTVIFGRNFETRSFGNRDWVVVPFLSNGETMTVQISIAPNKHAHSFHRPPGFPITNSPSM